MASIPGPREAALDRTLRRLGNLDRDGIDGALACVLADEFRPHDPDDDQRRRAPALLESLAP